MCGIAGIHAYHYAASAVDEEELRRIREYMRQRGPDGCGLWLNGTQRIGLAHRRLAIIDLTEHAAQPMQSADGCIVITFNGEIYNYRELRQELQLKGVHFRTQSDTEVILHLYADSGTAMLGKLRGMFAFAIWDANKQATLLARDGFGIKPLYYADDGWTCRFASQVKALLTSKRVSRVPEPAGITGFYLFGSVPEPYTLYQEIRAVPAGHYVWITGLGAQAPVPHSSLDSIWHEALQAAKAMQEPDPQIIHHALLDSVRHHLLADVPVGVFLSGGIDSGALAALIQETGKQSVTGVTLGFSEYEGTDRDEVPLAAELARRYGVEHHVHWVDQPTFQQDFPQILEAMDQPSIDGINTWYISKAARQAGLKVALSGIGGDELFGGYPSFTDIPRWVRRCWLPGSIPGLGLLAEQMHAIFAPLFPTLNPKARGMLKYGGNFAGAYLLRRGLFLPSELPALLGKDLAEAGLARLRPVNHIAARLKGIEKDAPAFMKVALLESSLYMRNQLLRDADWASMAHSLELRTPLIDLTLLKAVAPSLLASQGNRKQLLASSPTKGLPDAVRLKPKTGFTTPVDQWQQTLDHAQQQASSRAGKLSEPWARQWAGIVGDGFGL